VESRIGIGRQIRTDAISSVYHPYIIRISLAYHSRHDRVKRCIERRADSGATQRPPMVDEQIPDDLGRMRSTAYEAACYSQVPILSNYQNAKGHALNAAFEVPTRTLI
jgi:hypothetical protein